MKILPVKPIDSLSAHAAAIPSLPPHIIPTLPQAGLPPHIIPTLPTSENPGIVPPYLLEAVAAADARQGVDNNSGIVPPWMVGDIDVPSDLVVPDEPVDQDTPRIL